MKLKKGILQTDLITQIAIVTHNIDETAANYAQFFGVSKPSIRETETVDKAHTKYQGEPTEARAKLAFFKFKNVTLELIEPDKHPSTWREYLDTHGEGVHHIAFHVKKGKEKISQMESMGIPCVQTGDYIGGNYAYMDSSKMLKVFLELLEYPSFNKNEKS